MARHSPKTWHLLAALIALLAGIGAGAAEAEVRKSCRAIENDRMICTAVASPPDTARGKSPSTPATPPPWKAVVARAVLDGRCAEARRIALENGDLEAAQQAVALCVPR
jgi:hypothetical protein